jgi:hypothetical protein
MRRACSRVTDEEQTTMADTAAFSKMVPGFDFLQGLVKNAGSAMPSIGQWIAPTLNPEELEKRIEELRTVQFWLEQNARMLGATIQALEVQRMTLSTLKTMNVTMADLKQSLTPPAARAPKATPAASPGAGAKPSTKSSPSEAAATFPMAGIVDPTQWWGALTKQFTQLAASAMKDTATDAAKNLASAMVKQSFDTAGKTLGSAAGLPLKAAQRMAAGAAASTASRAPSKARARRAPAKPRKRATMQGED